MKTPISGALLGSTRVCTWIALVTVLLVTVAAPPAQAVLLTTYITGSHMGTPVVYRAIFDPAVKDSLVLSVAVSDPLLASLGGRLDNIDFVPGSSFSRVVATAQYGGAAPNGALVHYDVVAGIRLADFVPSTNAVAVPPASGTSRPASIAPNGAGTHFYYVENQFGFAGITHRMMRAPIAGGPEEVVFNGLSGRVGGGTLVEFSGVEIVAGRVYFFARDVAGPAHERQLYSVALGGGGLGAGAATLEVAGLDRSSAFTGAAGVGPGASDGSDELDFDPVSGLIYGTNIATGETIGFAPGSGPFASPAGLPFYIDGGSVALAANAFGTDDGLGLLSGVATPFILPILGGDPPRRIDGIRPTDDGLHLVVIGHDGVVVSIEAGTGAIIRLFNADVLGAGLSLGLDRSSIGFDDHTLLAPAAIPEPATAVLGVLAIGGLLLRRRAVGGR